MKTWHLVLELGLVALVTGCAHHPGSQEPNAPSGAGQRTVRNTRTLAAARQIPPLLQEEMEAKERMLLRIKLTERQEAKATPYFGRGPVELTTADRELGVLRQGYTEVTSRLAAPVGGPAMTNASAVARDQPVQPSAAANPPAIPAPTGRSRGSRFPSGKDAFTVPSPEPTTGDALSARYRRDTEIHAVLPADAAPVAANRPNTGYGEAVTPAPRGRADETNPPPQSISTDKRRELRELLRRYMADEIAPREYYQRRAEILAGP